MRDLSAASSWAAAGDPLRLAEWTASCFGTRLAEVTNASDRSAVPSGPTPRRRRAVPPVPTPRHRRAALDESRPAGANAAARAPVPLRANDGRPTAERRVPVAIARGMPGAGPPALPTGAMGRPRLAALPIGTMGRPRLAALAGDVSRALRSVSGRGRLPLDLLQLPLDSDARKIAPDLLTARSASISNAALEKRVSARLDRSLARAFGRPLPQAAAPAAATPSGWQRRLGDPAPDLVLAAAGAPIAAVSAAATDVRTPLAPARSRQPVIGAPEADFLRAPPGAAGADKSDPSPLGESHARSWRQPISPPDPQLTLVPFGPLAITTERVPAAGPARREPTPAPEPALSRHDRAAAMVPSVPSASGAAMVQSPSGQATSGIEAAKAFASGTPDTRSEPRAAGSDVASRPMWHRARLDPLEFAEQLRLALIHDARRMGIEV
jgi:hypothetical protein